MRMLVTVILALGDGGLNLDGVLRMEGGERFGKSGDSAWHFPGQKQEYVV